MVQRKPHRRILPQILLATTQRTAPTAETTTGNTITVKEDVKDATIVVEGVNVDTSTQTEVPVDAKEDKTIIKVGEGAMLT